MKYAPHFKGMKMDSDDARILETVVNQRKEALELFEAEEYNKVLDKTVESLKAMREFSDYGSMEFREAVVVLLFDLSEIHYALKDYKQSKKELEQIFKFLEPLLKLDADRFGKYHVMAMELSTRILRSRKKMLDMLAKQQIHTGLLYDKVHNGVATATDKLVESLCKDAEMMASTGDYKGAVKFYMEAIKLSKKRAGRVTRREVAMTIEVARLLMRSRAQTERARRLLNAVLPHAVALEIVELEQEILGLLDNIEINVIHDSAWRQFMAKMQAATRFLKKNRETAEEEGE